MPIELTRRQRRMLANEKEAPIRVIDPETNTVFVLVRADVFHKLQEPVGADDVTAEEMYPLLADLAPEDWEDASNYDIGSKKP